MKLSFVIPSFNSAAWLAQAVGSCLEQTHKDIEVVVVDDCSTDSTQDYLAWQTKADKRVVALKNQINMGRSVSRNIGNRAATGEVICVLDADDLALPNRAKITADKFSKGIEFLYGSAVQMDACGRAAGEIRADVFNKKLALETMQNRIVHSSVAYSRKFAEKYKYRDGDIAKLGIDDWALQIEAAVSGVELEMVPAVLCAYRVLASGISSNRDPEAVKKAKAEFLESLKVGAC